MNSFLNCCEIFWSTCWRRRDRGWQTEILHPEVPGIKPMATALSKRLGDSQGCRQTGLPVKLRSSRAFSSLQLYWTKMIAWRPKFVRFPWHPKERLCWCLTVDYWWFLWTDMFFCSDTSSLLCTFDIGCGFPAQRIYDLKEIVHISIIQLPIWCGISCKALIYALLLKLIAVANSLLNKEMNLHKWMYICR